MKVSGNEIEISFRKAALGAEIPLDSPHWMPLMLKIQGQVLCLKANRSGI